MERSVASAENESSIRPKPRPPLLTNPILQLRIIGILRQRDFPKISIPKSVFRAPALLGDAAQPLPASQAPQNLALARESGENRSPTGGGLLGLRRQNGLSGSQACLLRKSQNVHIILYRYL